MVWYHHWVQVIAPFKLLLCFCFFLDLLSPPQSLESFLLFGLSLVVWRFHASSSRFHFLNDYYVRRIFKDCGLRCERASDWRPTRFTFHGWLGAFRVRLEVYAQFGLASFGPPLSHARRFHASTSRLNFLTAIPTMPEDRLRTVASDVEELRAEGRRGWR